MLFVVKEDIIIFNANQPDAELYADAIIEVIIDSKKIFYIYILVIYPQ